jgi:hypothetical protein
MFKDSSEVVMNYLSLRQISLQELAPKTARGRRTTVSHDSGFKERKVPHLQPYSNLKLTTYAQGHMGFNSSQIPSIPQVFRNPGPISANHLLDMLAQHCEAGFRPNRRNVR